VLDPKLLRRGLHFLLTLVVAYVVVLIAIRLFESHLVFFPNIPGRLAGDWAPRGLGEENVWLKSGDGIKLHGWWIRPQGAEFTFLCFHGNAGNITDRTDIYRFLSQLPANVLAVEYRGYGKSEGKPSEAGLYRDAEAGYEYLIRERGIEARKIISYGQSLGTAVAADLASRSEVGGVVLEAPFASAAAVARLRFWFLPGLSVLVHSQFDTEGKLQRVRAPVLIAHCSEDPVIPIGLGERTYREAREPKTFVRIEGYCHEEASIIAPEKYRAALVQFLGSLRP
jgi:uncharacterized protein